MLYRDISNTGTMFVYQNTCIAGPHPGKAAHFQQLKYTLCTLSSVTASGHVFDLYMTTWHVFCTLHARLPFVFYMATPCNTTQSVL